MSANNQLIVKRQVARLYRSLGQAMDVATKRPEDTTVALGYVYKDLNEIVKILTQCSDCQSDTYGYLCEKHRNKVRWCPVCGADVRYEQIGDDIVRSCTSETCDYEESK